MFPFLLQKHLALPEVRLACHPQSHTSLTLYTCCRLTCLRAPLIQKNPHSDGSSLPLMIHWRLHLWKSMDMLVPRPNAGVLFAEDCHIVVGRFARELQPPFPCGGGSVYSKRFKARFCRCRLHQLSPPRGLALRIVKDYAVTTEWIQQVLLRHGVDSMRPRSLQRSSPVTHSAFVTSLRCHPPRL